MLIKAKKININLCKRKFKLDLENARNICQFYQPFFVVIVMSSASIYIKFESCCSNFLFI